jgi:hypothetical protein
MIIWRHGRQAAPRRRPHDPSGMFRDMPQPVRPTIIASFRPDRLHLRANLAIRIAIVSAIWGEMERELGMLLAAMIGAEARTVMGMYLSLVSAPRTTSFHRDGRRASIERCPTDLPKENSQKGRGQSQGESFGHSWCMGRLRYLP